MSGPTTATIKRLFAVSGNQCAFPGCELPLVDPDSGTVLGEICHIRASSPDGPRGHPSHTEKVRHGFKNLLLLCPAHHKVIDDNPREYSIKRLHEIKREHEERYAGGPEPSDIIVRQFLEPISVHDLLDTCHAQPVAFDGFETGVTVRRYLDRYGIKTRFIGEAADQIRHPLLLRFFCEAYKAQPVPPEFDNIQLKNLFDLYWDGKLDEIADRWRHVGEIRTCEGLIREMEEYLESLALYMLNSARDEIPIGEMSAVTGVDERYDDPRSMFGHIRDEHILFKVSEEQIGFVYEEFMAYVMARALMRTWTEKKLILAKVEKLMARYESFHHILNVIVYLTLMLKEKHEINLWPTLLDGGGNWYRVIIAAFMQLPEEDLDPEVYETLAHILGSDDSSLQKQALGLFTMDRIAHRARETAVAELMDILCELAAHASDEIRRQAVYAIGQMWDGEHRPPATVLAKALGDRRKAVRHNAVEAVLRRGEAAVELLGDVLANGNSRARFAALLELSRDGSAKAMEALIAVLKDKDEDACVREGAAEALGTLADARAVEPLIVVLKDKNEDGFVRSKAAEALSKIAPFPGDARVKESLIAALEDEDWPVREGAAKSLGKVASLPRDTRVIMPLIAALEDEHASVRRQAAEALGKLRDARAVEPLITALEDEDWYVRWSAANALKAITGHDFGEEADAWRAWWRKQQ